MTLAGLRRFKEKKGRNRQDLPRIRLQSHRRGRIELGLKRSWHQITLHLSQHPTHLPRG